ncbi:MAG TPA: endonuclease V [Nitrososphaera sp.]|nr:endonuclease V [Nitrososphaera sp.]
MTYSDAIKLQEEIAKKVATEDDFDKINHICGVDVAYNGYTAYCSAVVTDRNSQLLESVNAETLTTHPYVPGLLMLREAEPIFHVLGLVKSDYDLLLVDGHGLLHPRKCGLACYVGVTLDKPTIGVAKSRLCGTVRPDGFVQLRGEILGYLISKKLYVSVGHRVSLKTAIATLKEFGTKSLRMADINSKIQKRRKGFRP